MRIADLFCGAGGTSIGASMAGDVDINFALNHWDIAIQTHSKNFPETKHIHQSLKWVHPSEANRINLLFASPECTHHSDARGGRPTSNQQRSGAWELMPWIEYHRPSYVVVENVREFQSWGPVSEKTGKPLKSLAGRFFDAWLMAIRSAGYKVDFQRLNAADFGAVTSRDRLFIVAKKGRREFCWPEPTHCKSNDRCLSSSDLHQWRGAIEIIDWSIPLPSVFSRKRPLVDNTLARIEKGIDRHVAPMVVKLRNNMTTSSPGRPLGTITAGGGHHGIAVPAPFVVTVNHGDSGGDRSRSLHQHLPTITTRRGEAVACPIVVKFDNGSGVSVPRSASDPTWTLTTKAGQAVSVPLVMSGQAGGLAHDSELSPVPTITTATGAHVIVPFISSFYGTQNTSSIDSPTPTIPTKDRHSLNVAAIGDLELPSPRTAGERSLQKKMKELGIFEIGFRMLTNNELAAAQGFPMTYQFCGTKKEVTKQIGNSVSPPVARAITESLLSG